MKTSLAFCPHPSDLRRLVEDHGIHLCYSGVITEAILTSVGASLRHKLELEGIDRKTRKSIFSAFVEQAQNVIRYSSKVQDAPVVARWGGAELGAFGGVSLLGPYRYGSLAVGTRKDGMHYVTSSNVIVAGEIQRLKELIDEIRLLDRAGLMARMKTILKEGAPSGSRGAGVGLITIAREASGGLDYTFKTIDTGDNRLPHVEFTLHSYFQN
ncbi:MAG: DUF6272 family protein [Verrucomicrobiota bacterium]